MLTELDAFDTVCLHRPGLFNRWCDSCDALIVAGSILTGVCGHERMFPPGTMWTSRSWCGDCDRFREFGIPPPLPVAEVLPPPFWRGDFGVTLPGSRSGAGRRVAVKPFCLFELGRALRWPNVQQLTRQVGVPNARCWYRWRSTGLRLDQADRLAINAGLHPIEVWGADWEAGT